MSKRNIVKIGTIGLLFLMILTFSSSASSSDQSLPIFMYHSISEKTDDKNPYIINPRELEEQLKTLSQRGYHSMTAEDLIDYWEKNEPLPKRPIMLTFDDGYKDNYKLAYPLLKKYKMKATIFVVTGKIGSPRYMNWQQIEEMDKSGLVDIEAHTVHHYNLAKLNDKQVLEEMSESRRTLEEKLHRPVYAFAFPFGGINRSMGWKLKKTGFKLAVNSNPGWARFSQGNYGLHRIRVSPHQTVDQLLAQ